jgi:hypothetical protein
VVSTGHNTAFFPEISTALAGDFVAADFFALNAVILKACQPDQRQRYASAAEMREELLEVRRKLGMD